jgi:hypothetical protein
MLLGTVLLVAVGLSVTIAGRRVVASLTPQWSGPIRWLAVTVVAVSTLCAALQLCGWMRALSAGPIVVVTVALSGLVSIVGSRLPASTSVHEPPTNLDGRLERGIAAAALAVVAVQWTSHVADALSRGMTHADTLWYHLPFAARFVQTRSFTGLGGLGYEAARWFPFDSHAVHALGIALLHRDALSPLLNLGWAALAVLAAAALGDQVGRRSLAVLGAAVALGLPVLAGTQPGQASSDVACAALLLAAMALVRAAALDAMPTGLAGLAAGLAIATKVTLAVPFAVLVLGVLLVAVGRRRWSTAAAWTGGVVLTGAWWFVRDWVGAGSPLPWLDLRAGPLHLAASIDEGGEPLSRSIFDGSAWHDVYLRGLSQGLTRAWPLLAAMVLVAALGLLLARRRDGIERVLGAAVLAGVVGHVFTPLTGGFSFVFNLRYLSPVLLVALVLLPAVVGRVAAVPLVVLGVAAALTPHHERVAAWPGEHVAAAAAVMVIVSGAVVAVRLAGRWQRVVGACVAIASVLAWLVIAHAYEDARYAHGGLHGGRAIELFRHVSNARVAVLGTDETLPMFGLDLSNRVRRADDPPPSTGDCAGWRRHLSTYDYVYLTRFGFSVYRLPERAVLDRDPGARLVRRDGDTSVYAIDELHPERC